MRQQPEIGEEVFIYGLGYIIWDEDNERAAQELIDEIERIAPPPQLREG